MSNVKESKQTKIRKPGRRAQSKFRIGQESLERESRQTAGRPGVSRCKIQRQKVDQFTEAEMKRRGQ